MYLLNPTIPTVSHILPHFPLRNRLLNGLLHSKPLVQTGHQLKYLVHRYDLARLQLYILLNWNASRFHTVLNGLLVAGTLVSVPVNQPSYYIYSVLVEFGEHRFGIRRKVDCVLRHMLEVVNLPLLEARYLLHLKLLLNVQQLHSQRLQRVQRDTVAIQQLLVQRLELGGAHQIVELTIYHNRRGLFEALPGFQL